MNGGDGLNERRRRGVPWQEKADGYQAYQHPGLEDAEEEGLESADHNTEQGAHAPTVQAPSAHGRVQRSAGPVASTGSKTSTTSTTPKENQSGQKVPRKGQKSAQETKAMLARLNHEARGVEDAKRGARQAEDALKRRREAAAAAAKGRTTRSAPTTQRRADGRERDVGETLTR